MSTPGRFLDCEQGSELWAKLRCGYTTASRAADVIAVIEKGKNKGQEKAERATYRTELICERLTGVPYPRYVSRDMQWGLDHEDEAAAAYELVTGELVDKCGFVIHPTVSMFGASPDRLVGTDGLLQIKCPTTRTHLEWLQAGVIPVEHAAQMLAEMSCTGREWVDFCSFDPRLPEPYQIFIRRYSRNEKLIAGIEVEVAHFNSELDAMLKALPPGPAPVVGLLDQASDDEVQF
jgi:predicted phage-related endonuclease